MKFSKLSFIAILGMATISSCSTDNEFYLEKSEYVNSVRVTVEDFIPESPASRTAYTVDANGFQFQWNAGDALGIYPVGGDQVKFPISAGDGASTASFDGGAWKLRSEYQYAAYYPFSANNYTISERALPVNFTGQTQNGNGSTAHLGEYDYLACAATTPDGSGGVDLTMRHLGAFVRLQLTMPKADTFSSVVLESDGTKFVTSGTFDLTAATPVITPAATSSTCTINLTDVATTEKNQVITIYTVVAPANLSASNITVTVHGTGQTTYVQTVPGKNFVARSAYNIAVDKFPSGTNASGENVGWDEPASTGIENGHEWVDLDLPSGLKWATKNVGATTPEGFGDYFAWGETSGYGWDTSDGHLFNWESYKWCSNGENTGMTKYTIPDGMRDGIWYSGMSTFIGDNKTTLDLEDDAAYINWGGLWRMPTKTEQDELRNESNCIWTWTTQDGVDGYKVTSKKNGNSIFLPAAHERNHGYHVGTVCGSYMSSSLSGGNSTSNYYLYFESNSVGYRSFVRMYGRSVRAVCP